MGQKWIIDVIADLRTFAEQNSMPLLARQLEVTSSIAQTEIASLVEGAPKAANANASQPAKSISNTRSGN